MKECNIFLRIIEDKYERFLDYQTMDYSDFLSLEQQSLLNGFLRGKEKMGVFLMGGYENAERKLVCFIPEYIDCKDEDSLKAYFEANEEDSPFMVLSCKVQGNLSKTLSHRDYLGAILGEGIKREKIGDILVREDGADIIVSKDLGEYLEREFHKVGRASLEVKLKPISQISRVEINREEKTFNIASPRLDNVVAALFSLSRKGAVEAIGRGLVFVNGVEVGKADFGLKGGEKVVLRGKGKAIYLGKVGTSKKGKAYVKALLYK